MIRNCAFYNAISSWPAPCGVGICLKNVTNGRLENNKCYGNIYGIRLVAYSSNNTITNNDCYENNKGIRLDDSSNNNVASNNCYNNSEGIYLDDSSNNIVANNKCYGNLDGISLYSSSEKNIIANNTCYENFFAGIHLYHYLKPGYPSNNSIENNKCYKNREGIYLSSSHNNSITNCSVYDNSYGFRISSSNIQIHYCSIYGNKEYGISNENLEGEYEVNATYCWWGHGSGPFHETNPGGQGDNVSDKVLFIPWLEKTSEGGNTSPEKKGIPGFELFAIVGAVASILNRRKK
ncbi:MAG: right-handed parallel beta-helix repeat-containing protein [Thermoplasmatales archaeon]|nr:right-handed parallel beta-helix repeat-containing protein [Thermoplasmatales archaeon]